MIKSDSVNGEVEERLKCLKFDYFAALTLLEACSTSKNSRLLLSRTDNSRFQAVKALDPNTIAASIFR